MTLIVPGGPETEPIYDAFITVAKQMLHTAQQATADYLANNYPGAETVNQEIKERAYLRTVLVNGRQMTLRYDFRSKLVTWIDEKKAG
jgi:hypothetical protein